ncbi:T9SS type A sorting domain-containing protein, partial [Saprospiraceae bacterium]|nr:T9SS type A sorting domain-containing protein [Saprospiraceae bacterium]
LTLDDDLDQDGFLLADDCDDTNPDINPDAEEIPDNGIDEDCDGEDLIVGILNLDGVQVKVYPNPTNDFIYIENSVGLTLRMKLYSNSGQLLLDNMNINVIDVTNISPGIYFLKLKNTVSGSSKVERIVIF